jgi:hypothetical protein
MLRTVNDDVTSADHWELRGETNYKLTDRSYLDRNGLYLVNNG